MSQKNEIEAKKLTPTTDFLPSDEATCCASFVRMFKPQFASMVEAGTKLQTVRPTPKRMPKAGDKISLRCWEGKPYRSKQRILREAIIKRVDLCEITESNVFISWTLMDREPFALKDGFASWQELREWFRSTHGLPFVGVLISWHNDKLRHSAPAEDSDNTKNV